MIAGVPIFGRLAERLERRDAGLRRTGRAAMIKRLMSGAASPRSANTGVISSESAPSRASSGVSSRRKRGSRSMSASRSSRALGGRLRRPRLEFSMSAADVPALARERRERRVGVAREALQRLVLRGEDPEHLVDLLERRVGAADDLR